MSHFTESGPGRNRRIAAVLLVLAAACAIVAIFACSQGRKVAPATKPSKIATAPTPPQPAAEVDKAPEVTQTALRFMSALCNRDLGTLQGLSAGSVEGWMDTDSVIAARLRPPVGWSRQRIAQGASEMGQVYLEDPELLMQIREVAVAGDLAGVRVSPPKGKLGKDYFLVVFKRTAKGWRMATMGEATGPLSQELARRASDLQKAQLMTTKPATQPQP